MNVRWYDDVNAFYARVEPYLLRDEAVHNLTFGLLSTLMRAPDVYGKPVLALVESAGDLQLVALMTPPRPLVLSLAETPEAVTALVDAAHAAGFDLAGVNGPAAESQQFAETWSRLSGCSFRVNVPLKTFKLTRVKPVTGVAGHLRRATDADRDVLMQFELGFYREAFPDEEHTLDEMARAVDNRLHSEIAGMYVWDDNGVVSYGGYGGPTPHGIRIGPVFTPPEKRGHGYASACVAGMSQRLLDGGRSFCFLFTDRSNPTPNHIYQAIGYEPVCDFTQYAFERSK